MRRIWRAVADGGRKSLTPRDVEATSRQVFAAAARDGLRPAEAAVALLSAVDECAKRCGAQTGPALKAALRAICAERDRLDPQAFNELRSQVARQFPGAGELLGELLGESAGKRA